MQEHFKYHKRFGREVEKCLLKETPKNNLKYQYFFTIFTHRKYYKKIFFKKRTDI